MNRKKTTEPTEPWLDINGAAALLHASVATVRRLVNDGKLIPSRLGRRHRFDPEELRALLRTERTKKIGAAIAAKKIVDEVIRPLAGSLADADRDR